MNNEYLNDIASRGAIIGALMLASHIFEQSMIMNASFGGFAIAGLEMLVVTVIYIWLQYRFAKRASERFGDNTVGFPYSRALMYVVSVALFAGVIVGLGGYVYTHFIVGYENYIERLVENLQQMLYQSGGNSPVMAMYENMLSTLLEQPEPGIFSTIISSMFNYMLFGGVLVGLFIAAGVKRDPKPFDSDEHEEL